MSARTTALSPRWATKQISELDAADQRAKELIGALTLEQLNWQPGPAAWSAGQCMDHLCRATEVYLPALAAALEGRPTSAAEEITPGWLSRWFIRNFIEPSPNGKRASAPKKDCAGFQGGFVRT